MIISGYGIQLKRLTRDDLELVRNWRNAGRIVRNMEYREHISAEMQQRWFESVNNIHNHYFIICYKNEKIGVINGSETNWDIHETANGGIFIGNEDYLKTLIPLKASLLLTDFCFAIGLKRTFMRVLSSNSEAVSYNIALGYRLLENQENVYNQRYVLTQENYEAATKKIKSILSKESNERISLIIEDMEDGIERFVYERVKNHDTAGAVLISIS
jgi:UDP-4-amino-4,6-dideoxy-N-acetyl-beta-L-altrosamine N-acetyltransferase